MKDKFPNASILTLITQTVGGNENLLFIYLKAIPDFYPSDRIHWYDGAGKNGNPNNVWLKFSIKQWTGCGNDSIMLKLFDDLLAKKKLTIGGKKILLTIPQHNIKSNNADPFKNRSGNKFDSFLTENKTRIPQEFYQKENLQFLSATKDGSKDIKPLYPLGFFEDNFIYDNLNNGVLGIKEYRTAYLTFHGVRKTSEKGIGSKEMVGFYQQNFNPQKEYVAVIKSGAELEVGKAIIDNKTGFFKANLTEPTKKGKIEILVNDKKEKSLEYVLIQDMQVNVHVANATFKDAYGRDFLLTSAKNRRPQNITSFTWQQNIYADKITANQKLSDLFKSILDYLGPKILIADPYFFGDISEDSVTAELHLKDDQIALVNAMTHSALERGISKLYFLGYWGRAHNQLTSDGFNKYEKFYKNNIFANKLIKYFPFSSIEFRNAQNEFHNRYWFSLTDQDGVEVLDKCVIITNSIGNMSELDIIPVTDLSQLRQITRKYTGILNNSQSRLII